MSNEMYKIKWRLLDINMYSVNINFPTQNANILGVICMAILHV